MNAHSRLLCAINLAQLHGFTYLSEALLKLYVMEFPGYPQPSSAAVQAVRAYLQSASPFPSC